MARTSTILRWLVPLAIFASVGCASVTNPVADAIPVSRLPLEVLGRSKNDLKPIPLTVLRQREQPEYILDRGDLLAVVADDVVAPSNVPAPVHVPDANRQNGSIGFPIPVQDDGSITIPRLKPIKVTGMTLSQVEQAIKDAASGKNGGPKLINPDLIRITVQLLQKRTYSITVVREDTQPVINAGGGSAIQATSKRGNGFTLRLLAGEKDVHRALNATGGPPGLDARDEVIILRGTYDPATPEKSVTRIPLRLYPEQRLEIQEKDVILKDGDIVKIESRDTSGEIYYIGGVSGSRQFPLPRDYDLDVIQALAIANANLANGGFAGTQFQGNSIAAGLGTPSPALLIVLRQLPNGNQIPIRVDLNRALRDPRERIRVQGGDFLIVQERPGDAVGRWFTQTFRFSTVGNLVRDERDFTGVLNATFP